jgi:Na+/melibiose symporter-like transporter
MLTDAQVLTEWKRRRSTTWRAVRLALAVIFISGFAFWYMARTPAPEMNGVQLLVTFLVFCVLGIAMLVVIFRVNRLYRCPRCNTVPMGEWTSLGPDSVGYESGVALNPQRCSKCGAVLRDSN